MTLKATTAEEVRIRDVVIIQGNYWDVEFVARIGDLVQIYVEGRLNPFVRPANGLIYLEI